MPIVEIGVDATKVSQGLRQADQALDSTARKAKTTETAVKKVGTSASAAGNNLNAAFAATGGSLSVTRGLVSMTDGFKRADLSMAGFAASQTLLDLGRFSADLRSVGSATGAAGGAFSKLGAIIKANPLLTIAGVIAGAATVMGLFKDETKETANEWDRLRESIEKANIQGRVNANLGISSLGASTQGVAKTLFSQFSIDESRRTTGKELQGLLDMNGKQFEGYVGSAGLGIAGTSSQQRQFTNAEARSILREVYNALAEKVGEVATSGAAIGTLRFGEGPLGNPSINFRAPGVNVQELENRRLAAFRNEQHQRTALRFGEGPLGQQGYAFPNPIVGADTGGDLLRQTPGERARVEMDVAQRNADLANQRMDELTAKGRELGATLGDAFFDFARGAGSAREIIAGILADLARAGMQQGFAGLFGSLAGSFGATGPQTAADGGRLSGPSPSLRGQSYPG